MPRKLSRTSPATGDLFDRISSVEDSLVRTSAWLVAALDLLADEAGFGTSSGASLDCSVPGGFLSRTSMGFCQATEDGTWEPYSGRWGTAGITAPIGCLTLNISEWPSDAIACSLSDTLETEEDWLARNPGKSSSDFAAYLLPFYLSPLAANGILRRARKRNRALPANLETALRAMVE